MRNGLKRFLFVVLLLLFLFGAVFSDIRYIAVQAGPKITGEPRITIEPAIDPEKPMVALTFDDGPNYIYTPQVLEILAEYDVVATFFINGVNIQPNESLLQQMVDAGHQLADHTYNHRELIFLTPEEIRFEAAQTQLELEQALPGYSLDYIRAPYGSYNRSVLDLLDRPMVLWDIDPRDWEAPDADWIYNAIVPIVEDGDVVLLHDSNPRTVEAIGYIIPALLEQGYQFVTLAQLEEYRGIGPVY